MIGNVIGAGIVAGAAVAGQWLGQQLRPETTAKPGIDVEALPRRPRTLWAFIGGAVLGACGGLPLDALRQP
jgi:hypothetical protein